MEKTYLFYDIETTGLNPCFDQVLQFAAIRTDMKLNELERYELNVKLNRDIVPTPQAIITHHIGISKSQTGVTELAAIAQIHQLLNTPETISLGYNTLGFDDEFLRFSFYRNLLPPYTHQFAQNCSRMDLYPLTVMYYLFKPEILKWPQHNQQLSLKLEYLSAVNQLAKGSAHTAIVDVEATLALAKIFIQERDMWDYLSGYFNKKTDLERMLQLPADLFTEQGRFQEAILVDGKFGVKNNFLAPVLHLGQHEQYKNQNLWLRLDLENLTATTPNEITENTYVIRKKAGEGELLLPMKTRYLEKLTKARQETVQKNKAWLSKNPDLLENICTYHRRYIYPKIPHVDADAALYELAFPSREEENLFHQFHRAAAAKKMAIVEQFPSNIRKEQALRIMGRHFCSEFTPSQQQWFHQYVHQATHSPADHAAIDYRGQRKLTIPTALTDIATLQQHSALSTAQQALLAELNDYLHQLR